MMKPVRGQANAGRTTATGLAAALVTAVGAAICCIGPIAAAFLGLTSLGALSKYEFLRPWFTILTLAFLGWAFYLAYRPEPAVECEPGSVCETQGPDRIRTLNRTVLWIVTAFVIAIWSFPAWSAWLL